MYNAKTLFYHFRLLILASKINQQIMFFQSRFLDLVFLIFFDFFQKWSMFEPLQNPMGSKMAPKSTKWRKNAEKTYARCSLVSNPVFTKP
jgi:hypothetical protein